jgi:hypothetical protein
VGFFLFFFYLFLLSWLLTRIPFVQKSGLKARIVIALFVIKIIAGMFSGWMLRNDMNSDTWIYHKDALVEYHLLFNSPSEYFTNLFYTGYQYGYDGILQFHNSYWNDLKTNLMVKFVSVLHIFSFGHYYVNVILYNFLVFFGHIALFRIFGNVFKNSSKLLIVTCFLLPSLLLFSSTLHKEGLIFSAISITCYCFYMLINFKGFATRKILMVVLLLLLIFLFRSYIVIVLIPALFAWFISYRKKYSPEIVFSSVFIVSVFIFFSTPYFIPSVNLPQLVVQKQMDFLSLEKANSFIGINPLLPDFKNFLINAPQAFNHALLRPYLGDYSLSFPLAPFIAELMLYQFLFMLFLFFRVKNATDKPFIFFCTTFSLIVLLIIGYTVPILWAIIRYRSIYFPFLLTPIICSIDYPEIKKIIQMK